MFYDFFSIIFSNWAEAAQQQLLVTGMAEMTGEWD